MTRGVNNHRRSEHYSPTFAGEAAVAPNASSRCQHHNPVLSTLLYIYPHLPRLLTTLERATNMADSMEGVVAEGEQPKTENVEQKAIAGT